MKHVNVNKCRLNASICNNKQRWNEDKCRCECQELIDKDVCDKGFTWNPSNCECEFDKSFNIGEYLDYLNCKCRKRLFDKLIEECTENIDEVKIDNENENENKHKYNFFIVYIVFFSLSFAINIGIAIYFVYSHWHLKKDDSHAMFDTIC